MALALPPIVLVGLGAVQLQAVLNAKQHAQDVADSAALAGAQQLTIAPVGADQRASAWAEAQLESLKANGTVKVSASVLDEGAMKVVVDANLPSFFMNLFPAGGFDIHAEAVAEGVAQSPLCVIAFGSSSGDDLSMTKSARLLAPNCLVHSNQKVAASGGALIQGEMVEAVISASGPIAPSALVGAAPISDPFASLPIDTSGCAGKTLSLKVGEGTVVTLAPGLHTEDYDIRKGGALELDPGDHVFCGSIKLSDKANIRGDDVVLILDDKAKLDWKDGGDVSLTGRKTGQYAGFVIVDSRTRSGDLDVNSDPISNITGAIYVPTANLRVDGSKRAASNSAWTVVAAKGFEGQNAANLVINVNYASSAVPVPTGVGNRASTPHLKR